MSDPLKTESDTALAIEPWLTGAAFVAAAMLLGLAYPPGVALLALLLSILFLALRRVAVLEALRAMGLTGIAAAALGLWIIASVTWSQAVGPSLSAALPIGLLLVLAGPALLLRVGMTAPDRPPLVAIFLVLALTALLIFEAASGGAIARYVLGGISLTGALTGVLSLLLWPVALSVHRYFGRGEALVWLASALALTFFVGGGVHASVLAPIAFALAFLAPLLSAIVILLTLLVTNVLGPLSLAVIGSHTLPDISGPIVDDWTARLAAWQDGLATWAEQPVTGYGFGSAASADAGGGLILALLLGTGGVGIMLALIASILLILRVVRRREETWRTACIAGLCGAAVSTAGSGFGLGAEGLDGLPWGGLWFGTVAVAGFALAAGKAPAGGSLGSIFGTAPAAAAAAGAAGDADGDEVEDDGLYHFDDDDDFDEDDDDYDEEEDDDHEGDGGGEDDWDEDADEEEDGAESPDESRADSRADAGEWRIDPDHLDESDGGTLPPRRK